MNLPKKQKQSYRCRKTYGYQGATITLRDWDLHIYNGILLSHKKERNNAICSNMDATRDDHTKRSKSDRERQIPNDITYMQNLKKGYK